MVDFPKCGWLHVNKVGILGFKTPYLTLRVRKQQSLTPALISVPAGLGWVQLLVKNGAQICCKILSSFTHILPKVYPCVVVMAAASGGQGPTEQSSVPPT